MPPLYVQSGLRLSFGDKGDPNIVRELQRDLRSLGYLLHGIDGNFGAGTSRAIRSLQIDLLQNDGSGSDGRAPVAMTSFNDDGQGAKRVTAVDGVLNQALAARLSALIADPRVAKLPFAADPKKENLAATAAIASVISATAPSPFVAAMVIQESDGCHFHVPSSPDTDTYVTIGLDRNDASAPDRITSRGYGIGQATLFHHPPTLAEMSDLIADPLRNVQHCYSELRQKFDRYVAGPVSRADDRDAEHPKLALRSCRYVPSDSKFMRDCKACAQGAGKMNIVPGTPVYQGATTAYRTDQYYPSAVYSNVPNRADFLCDWPYAARRYNGSGNDSFHYQARILLNLLK